MDCPVICFCDKPEAMRGFPHLVQRVGKIENCFIEYKIKALSIYICKLICIHNDQLKLDKVVVK